MNNTSQNSRYKLEIRRVLSYELQVIQRHKTYLCLAWRWSFVLWWEGDRCHASWIWSLHELSRRFCCVVNASCCSEWSNSHINKRTTSSSAWLLTRSWVHTEHNNKVRYYKFSSSQTELTKRKYKGINVVHYPSSQASKLPCQSGVKTSCLSPHFL